MSKTQKRVGIFAGVGVVGVLSLTLLAVSLISTSAQPEDARQLMACPAPFQMSDIGKRAARCLGGLRKRAARLGRPTR